MRDPSPEDLLTSMRVVSSNSNGVTHSLVVVTFAVFDLNNDNLLSKEELRVAIEKSEKFMFAQYFSRRKSLKGLHFIDDMIGKIVFLYSTMVCFGCICETPTVGCYFSFSSRYCLPASRHQPRWQAVSE